MDYWLGLIPYVLFVGGPVLWLLNTAEKRALQRRRRLTTVAARFGLFLSWIATAVALILGGLGAFVFYTSRTSNDVWLMSGGLCAAALVVWLLGRGIYFVLAGSPPEEPQRSQASPDATQPTIR
jgi:hypothetical protein